MTLAERDAIKTALQAFMEGKKLDAFYVAFIDPDTKTMSGRGRCKDDFRLTMAIKLLSEMHDPAFYKALAKKVLDLGIPIPTVEGRP